MHGCAQLVRVRAVRSQVTVRPRTGNMKRLDWMAAKGFILGYVRLRRCCHQQRVPGGRQEDESHVYQVVMASVQCSTCIIASNPYNNSAHRSFTDGKQLRLG